MGIASVNTSGWLIFASFGILRGRNDGEGGFLARSALGEGFGQADESEDLSGKHRGFEGLVSGVHADDGHLAHPGHASARLCGVVVVWCLAPVGCVNTSFCCGSG